MHRALEAFPGGPGLLRLGLECGAAWLVGEATLTQHIFLHQGAASFLLVGAGRVEDLDLTEKCHHAAYLLWGCFLPCESLFAFLCWAGVGGGVAESRCQSY